MTIVLKYTTEDGTEETVEFEDFVSKIELDSKSITQIDLTPLSSCSSLQGLSLNWNELQTIDLSPLSSCSNLKWLSLERNKLQSIDLTPLSSCSNLHELNLRSNQIRSIDLSPLVPCRKLDNLVMDGNFFHMHSWVSKKTSSGNVSYAYKRAGYLRPAPTTSWPFLHMVTETHGRNRRVQQDILCAIGLKNYGFIDCDLSDLFISIPAETPIDKSREQVREYVLGKIIQSIDQKGATTGLGLGELSQQHVEIAKRAQKIIKLRNAEMQQVQVRVFEERPPCSCGNNKFIQNIEKGEINCEMCGRTEAMVHLHKLWLTAYGYEILTALGMNLTTDMGGLRRVKTALAELGFELKTGKTSISGVRMSDELKQAIWWIVKNRIKPWTDISE